ncbi:MAG: hypothetical protein VB141_09600 [Burkholderia gladioli]
MKPIRNLTGAAAIVAFSIQLAHAQIPVVGGPVTVEAIVAQVKALEAHAAGMPAAGETLNSAMLSELNAIAVQVTAIQARAADTSAAGEALNGEMLRELTKVHMVLSQVRGSAAQEIAERPAK